MLQMDKLAKGIDVSHHRGSVDWNQVRASGVSFGIVKCTDGTTFIDRYFDINWTRMRRAKILRGAYHFFRPQYDPKVQANHFLRMVKDILHETDLPPVLDFEAYPLSVREAFESLTLEERLRRTRVWLKTVEYATGRIPIIYTNISTWKYYMANTTEFSRHPLWIANYGVEEPNVPANNWGGNGWAIWQITDQVGVPGVNDGEPPTDWNAYRDTEETLYNWIGFDGTRALPPLVLNQEMMEALIRAAYLLGQNPNVLIEKAGLAYLGNPAENLPRPYDGPAIQDLPISEAERAALIVALQEISNDTGEEQVSITNQQIINAFYAIAGKFNTSGWKLIELAELESLIDNRESLYSGPKISDLPGLTMDQKIALMNELGLTDLTTEAPGDPVEDPVIEEPPPVVEDPVVEEPVIEEPPVVIDEPVLETPPELIPEPLPLVYPGLINQTMINAFYACGELVGIDGWKLIERAGLASMAEARASEYSGPRIVEMDVLNPNIQARIREEINDDLAELQMSLPYPGLLNQDVINLFYRAAAQTGEDGWQWAEKVGLDYMVETRQMRYEPYRGPFFEDLQGLNVEQLTLLQGEIAEMAVF